MIRIEPGASFTCSWGIAPRAVEAVAAEMVTLASNLEAARSQMAFTLGFHIILASLGVALPALMLIANYLGLRRDDRTRWLAQRWSKVVAVIFAVGAVTGTVLSFELGLLWPAFTGRFGVVFGVLFALEGIFIFFSIYLLGWKRLSPLGPLLHRRAIPDHRAPLSALMVVAANSWMNQPQGFSPTTGDVTSVEPLEGDLQPGGAVRGPAHDPGGLSRHRVPRRLGLRGRDAAWPA